MTDHVLVSRADGVMRITMNRPDKKNALTGPMYDVMTSALNEADASDDIRAILLEGSGGSFTAGNDMGDFLQASQGKATPRATQFIHAIALLETPIVAAVNGHAVGVGTTLVFHCDLVFAAPGAKFRMPFVDIGLVPEAASSLTVVQRVGLAKATELLLLADGFDGAEAVRLGIANRLVDAKDLGTVAYDAAKRLAAKPPMALKAARKLIRGDRAAIKAAMDAESAAFAAALAGPEARRALEAFMGRGKAAAE